MKNKIKAWIIWGESGPQFSTIRKTRNEILEDYYPGAIKLLKPCLKKILITLPKGRSKKKIRK